jgi:hypothetical protein
MDRAVEFRPRRHLTMPAGVLPVSVKRARNPNVIRPLLPVTVKGPCAEHFISSQAGYLYRSLGDEEGPSIGNAVEGELIIIPSIWTC